MNSIGIGSVLLNTLFQSFLSSILVLFLGTLGALGLNSFKNLKLRALLESLCFFTAFLPSLFIIIASLNVIKPFPFGFWGIVLLHVISMVGFCSVVVAQIFRHKLSRLEALSYLEGASTFLFLRKSIGHIRADFVSIFIYTFIVMLTSFSIPFIVGYEYPVLETYIFNILKTEANIAKAFGVGLIEILFVYSFVYFFRRNVVSATEDKHTSYILKNKLFLLIPVLPTAIIIAGLLKGSVSGWEQLQRLSLDLLTFFQLSLKSIFLGITTGSLILILFLVMARYIWQKNILENLYRILLPGTALVGLFMWWAFGRSFSLDLQLVFGFIVLFFIPLFRLKFFDNLKSLEKQIQVAELMGASRNLIYKKIIFPQILETSSMLAGFGAFWAMGDFALSHMIYGNDSTLALFIQALASQYRVEAAALLLFALFFQSALVYIFFRSLKYVYR